MAAWVRLQLRQGSSVGGGGVVSAANLAECWKPHVTLPLAPDLDPDAVKAGYGMGWLREEYKDGTSVVWHNGSIDGFTTYMAFLPQHDLGLVVLNNMTAAPTGTLWYTLEPPAEPAVRAQQRYHRAGDCREHAVSRRARRHRQGLPTR